ncbi:MAG: hypothetical protein MSG78_09215 [Clostridiales bacterium]|nr:hypothetical protein [Clostridiales bacterium]
MTPQVYQADERVREDIGKAAVMCGSVVYCAEEADNGKNLHLYKLIPEEKMEQDIMQIGEQFFPIFYAKAKNKKTESQMECFMSDIRQQNMKIRN